MSSSASEKLGALEAEIDALINAAPQKSQGAFASAALPLLFDVSNALPPLPLIADVVEAADEYAAAIHRVDNLRETCQSPMCLALTALRAALVDDPYQPIGHPTC